MKTLTHIRFIYAAKRFAFYFLIGTFLNLMPHPNMVYFAIIPTFVSSIALALIDAFTVRDLSFPSELPVVFNRLRIMMLIGTVASVLIIDLSYHYWICATNCNFIGFYFFLGLLSLVALLAFFMYFASSTHNRRVFAYKRFAAYLLMGFTAASFPLPFVLLLGPPIIIIAAILLATTDALSVTPPPSSRLDINPTPVFTRAYVITLLSLVLFIAAIFTGYLLVMSTLYPK